MDVIFFWLISITATSQAATGTQEILKVIPEVVRAVQKAATATQAVTQAAMGVATRYH